MVAKKGGWIFNCDGFGNAKVWEEGKLVIAPTKNIADILGYRSVSLDEKTGLGNAHTGLMRMIGLNLKPNEESNLIPYGKKPKIERSSSTELDIQNLKLDGEKVKISELFWEGAPEEKEITAIDDKGNELPLKVNMQGPIAGAIIIYNETLLG